MKTVTEIANILVSHPVADEDIIARKKAKQREYNKRNYEKNKDKIIEGVKKYYTEHKDEKLKGDRDYYQKNKEKVKANSAVLYKKLRTFYDDYAHLHKEWEEKKSIVN